MSRVENTVTAVTSAVNSEADSSPYIRSPTTNKKEKCEPHQYASVRTCDQNAQTECVLFPTVPPYTGISGATTIPSAFSRLHAPTSQRVWEPSPPTVGSLPAPSDTSLFDRHSTLQAQSYVQLLGLRTAIQNCMDCVGGGIYDLLSFKDILLQLSDRIPEVPITDLTLIASKLYRYGGDLSALLQSLFQNVYSDGFTDESFHFVHMRLMKAEVAELRAQVTKLTSERDDARNRYREVSQGIEHHAVAIETLENRNDVLELRSSALEDQMALLFGQLSDDFLFYNQALLTRTTESLGVQKELSAPRSVFSQNIDGVQKRLLHFQSILNEIQQDSKIMNGADGGSIKAKVKTLEHHLQQLYSRFTSVKDGLLATSEELLSALADKKKILNFCCEHIKLYDLQNQKLRNGRAQLHELRQRISVVERCVTDTLGGGQSVSIDRHGDISIEGGINTLRLGAGSPTGSTSFRNNVEGNVGIKRHQLESVRDLQEHLQAIHESADSLTLVLDGTNEQRQLLKAVSLATPSTKRGYGGTSDGSGGDIARRTPKDGVEGGGGGAAAMLVPSAEQLLVSLKGQLGRVESRRDSNKQVGRQQRVSSHSAHHHSIVGDSSRRGSALPHHGDGDANRTGSRRKSAASTATVGGSVGYGASTIDVVNLKREFLTKLVFMRGVYEARIADLEARLNAMMREQSGRHPQASSAAATTFFNEPQRGDTQALALSINQLQQQQHPASTQSWTFTPTAPSTPSGSVSVGIHIPSIISTDHRVHHSPGLDTPLAALYNEAGYAPIIPTAQSRRSVAGFSGIAGEEGVPPMVGIAQTLEGLSPFGSGGRTPGGGKTPEAALASSTAQSLQQWSSTREALQRGRGSTPQNRHGLSLEGDLSPGGGSSSVASVRMPFRAKTTSSLPAGISRWSPGGVGGRGEGSCSPRSSPAGRGGIHFAHGYDGEGNETTDGAMPDESVTISIYSVADARSLALSTLTSLVRGTEAGTNTTVSANISSSPPKKPHTL